MSTIKVKIKEIKSCDSLHIVRFSFLDTTLGMMSLELDSSIKEDVEVFLSIKPTNVAIGKGFSGEISYSNQISAIIDSIEYGELLCSIKLKKEDTIIDSIITKDSAKRLDLKKGDSVVAFIKASDVSIAKVCDE